MTLKEEELPEEVREKLNIAERIVSTFSKGRKKYTLPLNATVYLAARLAGLNPVEMYRAYMTPETDDLDGLIARCEGMLSLIEGDGLLDNKD